MPVLALGYRRCLRLIVCPSVCVYIRVSVNNETVRNRTQQPFKLS